MNGDGCVSFTRAGRDLVVNIASGLSRSGLIGGRFRNYDKCGS